MRLQIRLPLALTAMLTATAVHAAPLPEELTGVIKSRACTPMWTLVNGATAGTAQGPVCDPAHEKFVLAALRKAGFLTPNGAPDTADAAEYLRGAAWNDDPLGELFDPNGGALTPASNGRWASHFLEVEKQAVKGRRFGPGADLLGRVHFGDLQHVHAMSAVYGQNPYDTFDRVILWVEFLYGVATGTIAGDTPLAKLPVQGLSKLFGKGRPATVNELFGVAPGKGDVQKRALGALLHFAQDALLTGHTTRAENAGVLGGIRAYASNEKHVSDRHRRDQGWRDLWSDGASVFGVAGGRDIVLRTVDLAFLVRAKKPWPAAREYVEVQLLSLSGVRKPAGKGTK